VTPIPESALLDIPLVPPSPNVMRRKYRSPLAYRRLRQLWETNLFHATGSAALSQKLKQQAEAKNAVAITVYHKKPYDPDNLTGSAKVVLDALRNIGFIKDDSARYIALTVEQVVGPDKRTTVRIEAQ